MADAKDKIIYLDPKAILADDNSRYSLKAAGVEKMAASIAAEGRVLEPVLVEPVTDAGAGITHRLLAGFYRHAAVMALNEQGADMQIPAIARAAGDETARLKSQVRENVDREDQSPMDRAISIQRLLDAGVPKPEVRAIFAVPGGRKGNTVQPLSNASLNMHLSFLTLPKAIQAKIHDGIIGVASAYQLTKLPKDKQLEVLAKAEATRAAELEREEKEEAKLAAEEAKANEATAKVQAAQDALDKATTEERQANEALTKAEQAKIDASKITVAEMEALSKDEKKKASEKIGAAKTNLKAAQKAVDAASKAREAAEKALAKLTGAAKEAEAQVTETKAKKAAKPASAKKAGVSPKAVKKAAAETSGKEAPEPLTAAEMRAVIKSLTANAAMKVTRALGMELLACFNGELVASKAVTNIQVLVGDRKMVKA